MERRLRPTPYLQSPILRPEGNTVENLYGRQQKRPISQLLPTIGNAASTVTQTYIKIMPYGGLIKENQILIADDIMVNLTAITPNDKSLSILSIELLLSLTSNIGDLPQSAVWGTPMQYPFSAAPTLVNDQFFKGNIPAFRWDDFYGANIDVFGPNNALKFLDSILWLSITVNNTDAVNPHSYKGFLSGQYTTIQLENS